MKTIGFIGAGSMTEAFLAGMVNGGVYEPKHIYVTNKSNEERLNHIHQSYGVNITSNKQTLCKKTNVIILSVKPKGAEGVIRSIKPFITKDHLIISVMAGVSIEAIEEILGEVPIIRAMPNTSATIRLSATGLAKGTYTTNEQLQFAQMLFEAIGMVQIVEEPQLDAVTGLAGSGPAYIYYVVEALEKAAKEMGLDEETARNFIVQTLQGASEMLRQTTKEAAQLRQAVTSPGGTTEAGISVLESQNVQSAIVECVKTAEARSKQLKLAFFEQVRAHS